MIEFGKSLTLELEGRKEDGKKEESSHILICFNYIVPNTAADLFILGVDDDRISLTSFEFTSLH